MSNDSLPEVDGFSQFPKKRSEAIALNAPRYFTGKPCKKGHVALRSTATKVCLECSKDYQKKYRDKKPNGWNAEKQRKYRSKNLGKVRTYARQYRAKNIERIREKDKAKYRANPDSKKHSSKRFREKNPEYTKQYHQRNKEKRNSYSREYYIAYRDRIKAQSREYDKRNPGLRNTRKTRRRSRLKGNGGNHTYQQIKNLLIKQRKRCAICKRLIKRQHHVDHIIPIYLGGSNDISNIQLLCPSCNHQKSFKDPIEFMQSRGFLL